MKFRCASNAAIKKDQNRKKKNELFFQIIFNKSASFFKKILIFRRHKVYFQNLEVLPVILTTYLLIINRVHTTSSLQKVITFYDYFS